MTFFLQILFFLITWLTTFANATPPTSARCAAKRVLSPVVLSVPKDHLKQLMKSRVCDSGFIENITTKRVNSKSHNFAVICRKLTHIACSLKNYPLFLY